MTSKVFDPDGACDVVVVAGTVVVVVEVDVVLEVVVVDVVFDDVTELVEDGAVEVAVGPAGRVGVVADAAEESVAGFGPNWPAPPPTGGVGSAPPADGAPGVVAASRAHQAPPAPTAAASRTRNRRRPGASMSLP